MKNLILIAILFNASIFADYSNHKDSKEVIDELVNEHGFEESYVINVLKQAKKRKTALNSVARPAEKTKTWDDYRAIFLKKKRISDGKKFIQNNITVLERAEKEFGVPKEVITAILGVETDYGNIMGSYRVIDSLTTLGFDDPRRSKFFKSELIQFFILTRENNLDILKVKGSYAGAMGYGQFISSSYRAYAIDFDGDGYVDLFNSLEDAIGSTANYLKRHGWKKEGSIVTRVYPNNVRKFYKPHESLTQFIPLTFTENGEELHFVGDDNFRAIARYNISDVYAMAVYYLSEEFKK
ncbi:MAG: lytic murein transglycosylase B [SAR86 cluster bacterium SAR86A]|jgi:membrane-bound lytic murein transglycosylase B|uniref:Lytic murein transglycosylase B n=1 Tax=SAR86 cluster bacterium SAR86A TaxID=1123866 RepID=J4UYG7_9GAMM|nr:MAG: lytic murein transglycosylase B [SAR86 cluster bacterium SAR86A]